MSILITDKEQASYTAALAAKPPVEAGLNRVLVIQIREENEPVEEINIPGLYVGPQTRVGSIIMPQSSKDKLKDENETVKGVIKSIGVNIDNREPFIKLNDLVMVFPSVFETKMTFDGIDYFVYSERDLVAVEREVPLSSAEIHKMD